MLNKFEKVLKILFTFFNLSGQYQLAAAAAACFYRLPIRMITIDPYFTAILVSEKVNYVNNMGRCTSIVLLPAIKAASFLGSCYNLW